MFRIKKRVWHHINSSYYRFITILIQSLLADFRGIIIYDIEFRLVIFNKLYLVKISLIILPIYKILWKNIICKPYFLLWSIRKAPQHHARLSPFVLISILAKLRNAPHSKCFLYSDLAPLGKSFNRLVSSLIIEFIKDIVYKKVVHI